MCGPAALPALTATEMFAASMAMTIATTAVSYMQQSAQAEAQQAANNTQAEMNRRQVESANAAMFNDAAQIQLRQRQEQEADSQKLQQAQTEAVQARAKERVAAGEAGVAGISLERILGDFERREVEHKTSVLTNSRATQDQLNLELKGLEATANSRINSITPIKPVAQPSFLDAGMRIVGGGMEAFGRYSTVGTDGKRRLSN